VAVIERGELFGSAPRVRGTLDKVANSQTNRRFSPACAGNTSTPEMKGTGGAVQPRVCGEHILIGGTGALVKRFSPACAGNTTGVSLDHI